jgi:hypothetical protein
MVDLTLLELLWRRLKKTVQELDSIIASDGYR